jgi:hypothetical protein
VVHLYMKRLVLTFAIGLTATPIAAASCPNRATRNEIIYATDDSGNSVTYDYDMTSHLRTLVLKSKSGQAPMVMSGCRSVFGCEFQGVLRSDGGMPFVHQRRSFSLSIDSAAVRMTKLGDKVEYVITESELQFIHGVNFTCSMLKGVNISVPCEENKYRVSLEVKHNASHRVGSCLYPVIVLEGRRSNLQRDQQQIFRQTRIVYSPDLDIVLELSYRQDKSGKVETGGYRLVDIHH